MMIKQVFMSLALIMPACLYAEANVDTHNTRETFLLKAPGTLSGERVREGVNKLNSKTFSQPATDPIQPRRYKYVGQNHFKIPQYGQQAAQNNPWIERRSPVRPAIPGPVSPYDSSYINPWHMDGAHPPGLESVQTRSFPFNPSEMLSPNLYGEMGHLYSGFSDGMFRDTNPAAITPSMNNFFPGMNENNFGLPYSPFRMFD